MKRESKGNQEILNVKVETENRENLRMSCVEYELSQDQLDVIKWSILGRTPQRLVEYTDLKEDTVYRILKGLRAENEGIPQKYQCDSPILEKKGVSGFSEQFHQPTYIGMRILREIEVENGQPPVEGVETEFHDDENVETGDGFGRLRLRPHKMRSEHSFSCSQGFDGSWFQDFLRVSEERLEENVETGVVEDVVEGSDGRSVRLGLDLSVEIESYRVEVFEDKLVLELDFAETETSIPEFWNYYLMMRDKVLRKAESRVMSVYGFDRFSVLDSPEHCEASMLEQEWAVVGQSLAEWFYRNRDRFDGLDEFSSGRADFVVRDENGEEIILIDRSGGEPELEFVDPDMGRVHAENFSRSIFYFATQDISPDDVKALGNLDRIVDSLREDVDGIREEVSVLRDSMPEGLQSKVSCIPEIREKVSGLESRFEERIEVNEEGLKQVKAYAITQIEQLSGEVRSNSESVDELYDGLRLLTETVGSVGENLDSLGNTVERTGDTLRKTGDTVERTGKAIQDNSDAIMDLYGLLLKTHGDLSDGIKENAVENGRQDVKQKSLASQVNSNAEANNRNVRALGRRVAREKYFLYDLRSWLFGKKFKRLKWMELRQFTHQDLDWYDVSVEKVMDQLGVEGIELSGKVSEEVFFSG